MNIKTINKLIITGIFLSMMLILTLIAPVVAQAQYYLGLCTPNYQQKCLSNNLYWYDSCGNQQGIAQYCSAGCYNGSTTCGYNNNYNYNNYGNCSYHAYKLCVGNNIYWYDGCNNQQDLYTNCFGGQTCQYGQCVNYIVNPVLPPVNNYVAYSRIACYGNSIHWFDSLGSESGIYKNCDDGNACTADTCSAGKCKYTQITNCPSPTPDPIPTPTPTPTPIQQPNLNGLTISFFTKQNSNSNQWQKTSEIGQNSQVYFMATISNNSTFQIDNINVSANIPNEISYLGNLQLNGVPISGDIVSGINIGSISPSSAKTITLEGKTQTISTVTTKQAIFSSNILGTTQSDSVSLNFSTGQVTASVATSVPATSGFWEFIKRWYLWIIVGLVLIFLFIIVFKRLSSEA